MAATLKKPSREKEEAGAGNMMLDVHPLHPSRPFPNRKPNRENRIKNACFSNSHINIALSNDKRPLFVQIPATSSASLVSTSLPVQCLRPTNFFFSRGIFPNSFLCHQLSIAPLPDRFILLRLRGAVPKGALTSLAEYYLWFSYDCPVKYSTQI